MKARFVYTGTPFLINKRYAEHFGSDWVILSAKYGFIGPDFMIPEDYNITFNDLKSNPITKRVCIPSYRPQSVQLHNRVRRENLLE